MGKRPDYRLGRILFCYLLGRNGKRESHPAVIVTPDAAIVQPTNFDPRGVGGTVLDNLIGVLGISTKYKEFADPYVKLSAGPETELTEDSAVILNWIATPVIPNDCLFLLGDVPAPLMVQINSEYRKLLEEKFKQTKGPLAQALSIALKR